MKMTVRVVVLALVMSMALTTQAVAGELTHSTRGQKALRGAANLTLGLFIEWPKMICYEAREQGPLLGIPSGFLAGFGLGLMRMGVGAYELVTFPVAIPDDYRPILSPRYPFEPGRTVVSPALIARPQEGDRP
ncbi:exosortase system-associated protein, TIGR04073 family [Candidatus Methylomirabilis sp.]|uniref:exosortase system-associated protein, TIGR04073 family n=1 Tax=Candidatus Methylomirabilis sp. TaxID=2032687 RepID=UPI002A6600D2|nr:exosortase system-associated protein, TIGR04073 family [Candidatus Methylomirabilis sp.]